MDYQFVSPWKYLTWTGIFGMILCLISILIASHTECQWTFCGFDQDNPHEVETFSQIWNSITGLNYTGFLLLFSIYMTGIIVNADLAMIVLWFTPSHLGISDILIIFRLDSNSN